jgi:hypothetical protein
MVFTRQEREQLVLDLHHQGKGTREIAKEAKMSFSQIGAILKRAAQQREIGQIQVERTSISTQAYRLFSESKTALQVTIDLQIKADEAIGYQKEYWELNQLDSLSQLYKEEKGNILPLVNLHRLLMANKMNLGQVINLLKIANNDLALMQHKFEQLSKDVISLELEKQNSTRICQELRDNIASSRKREDYVRSCCQIEISRMDRLYKKQRSLEGFVQFFENNNETYLTIKKTVEEKVHNILSDGKMLLKLAVLSLVDTLRNNPDKFSSLLYRDVPSSTTNYSSQNYGYYMYEQKKYSLQDPNDEISVAWILQEADKLYNKLAKELVDEIITDYASSITSSSLPDEKQEKTPVFPKHTLDIQQESKENGPSVQCESSDIKTNDY